MITAQFGQARSTLGIGKNDRTAHIFDTVGQFIALPPAIELRRDTASHGDCHIENYPVGRIARRNPDPVAFLNTMPRNQSTSQSTRCGINFPESQPYVAINQKFFVRMLGREKSKKVRNIAGCILEYWHIYAIFPDSIQFQKLPRLNHHGQCFIDNGV